MIPVVLTLILGASLFSLGWDAGVIIAFMCSFFLLAILIRDIGKKVLYLRFIMLLACFQWMLAPAIFRMVGVKPPYEYGEYMTFCIIGTLAFILGLAIPISKKYKPKSDLEYINRLETYLEKKPNLGLILFLIGIVSFIAVPYVPSFIIFITGLVGKIMFVGLFYIFFSKSRLKIPITIIGVGAVLFSTVLQGMIGTMIFWSITFVLILSLKYRPSLLLKLSVVIIGGCSVLVLQSVKVAYRVETWDYKENALGKRKRKGIDKNPNLMLDLITERIQDPSKFFTEEALIGMALRMNQARQLALVMKRVPDTEPHSNGEMTLLRPVQALIPRLVYPNKPISPDPRDYPRFTGITLTDSHAVSIGPLGEAYADFGKFGVIFLFFNGLMLNGIYRWFLAKSRKAPTFLLWFPFIFVISISSIENSIAGAFNAYIKAIVFIAITFFVAKFFFRTRL